VSSSNQAQIDVSKLSAERDSDKRLRSKSEDGSANRQFSDFLTVDSCRGRRSSVDFLSRKKSIEYGIPDWLYEDVPDPDAEDWGKLNGILGILDPEKEKSSKRPEPPSIQLDELSDNKPVNSTIKKIFSDEVWESSTDLSLETFSSIQQPTIFPQISTDSQAELLGNSFGQGLGFIDVEVESINSRRSSLPVHPQYFGPVFRSIPTWIPIRTIYIASFLLILTLVLNLTIIGTSISQWDKVPECSTEIIV
jgi:hypothetical protein